MSEREGNQEDLLVRAARRFSEGIGEIVTLVGTAFLAVAGYIEGNWWQLGRTGTLVAVGLAFTGLGVYLRHRQKEALSKVREALALERAKVSNAQRAEREAKDGGEDALSLFLVNVAKRYGLTAEERISVYAFDGVDAFYQLARHSENTALKHPGRERYPYDQGYLGAAWKGDPVYAAMVPDHSVDPDGYRRHHGELGLPDEVIDDLTMRSRAYFGFAVTDPAGNQRVGVVMVESMRAQGLTTVKDAFADTDRLSLGGLVLLTRPASPPAVSQARRSGF
ncbi:MAG TPA: hypothetical protein VGW38_09330 [Chloroflexota bacterium]|nr:hypothetical protein [Chloroflexota bacterium]